MARSINNHLPDEPGVRPLAGDTGHPARARALVGVAAAATALSAALALLGWVIDLPALKSFGQPVPMSPATAVCFILCAAVLWVVRDSRVSTRGAGPGMALARGVALFVAGLGALKLTELCLGWE